eukprot:3034717-Lingulodinium_polyedra.AAC.1
MEQEGFTLQVGHSTRDLGWMPPVAVAGARPSSMPGWSVRWPVPRGLADCGASARRPQPRCSRSPSCFGRQVSGRLPSMAA